MSKARQVLDRFARLDRSEDFADGFAFGQIVLTALSHPYNVIHCTIPSGLKPEIEVFCMDMGWVEAWPDTHPSMPPDKIPEGEILLTLYPPGYNKPRRKPDVPAHPDPPDA